MRLGSILLCAGAALSLTAAYAATTYDGNGQVPQQFVLSGKAADRLHDHTSINSDTAERLSKACEAIARRNNSQVVVVVLDPQGLVVHEHRMDGEGWIQVKATEQKALTALRTRATSHALANRNVQDPFTSQNMSGYGLTTQEGGLPIIVSGQLIGAIGVGGSAPRVAQGWSDEICAHKAMTEVLGPQPPLVQDLPPRTAANRGNAPVPRFDLAQGVVPRSSLPPEFVVSGKAAANIFDANQISGEAAKKIARTCRAWAAEHGGSASIYIIDTHGTFVHQERGDGQVYTNIHTAMLKAQTALQTRQPTSIRAAQLRNDPGGQPRQLMQFGFFTVSGGLPIVVDGEMIGAIGVGGGAGGGGDENCAIEGLKAAFGDRVLLPTYPQQQDKPQR